MPEGMQHFQPNHGSRDDEKRAKDVLNTASRRGEMSQADEEVLRAGGLGDLADDIRGHTWDERFPWKDKGGPAMH